jgi:small subunit ribosomal protein S9
MEENTEKVEPVTFKATGRRKEAVCHVTIKPGRGDIQINGRPKDRYLCREVLIRLVTEPLEVTEMVNRLDIEARAGGGGVSGQAGAMRLAIARALVKLNPELRSALKKGGFLTVDDRKVERKKYGRPKARKRFQFSKR